MPVSCGVVFFFSKFTTVVTLEFPSCPAFFFFFLPSVDFLFALLAPEHRNKDSSSLEGILVVDWSSVLLVSVLTFKLDIWYLFPSCKAVCSSELMSLNLLPNPPQNTVCGRSKGEYDRNCSFLLQDWLVWHH